MIKLILLITIIMSCDECHTFREKKWKLCAKCGTTIIYPEETRAILNKLINIDIYDKLIIDASNVKLDTYITINKQLLIDLNNNGLNNDLIHSLMNQSYSNIDIKPIHNNNTGEYHYGCILNTLFYPIYPLLSTSSLIQTFKNININSFYIFENITKTKLEELNIIKTNEPNRKNQISFDKYNLLYNKLNNKQFTYDSVIKLLINNRISNPLILKYIRFNDRDNGYIQLNCKNDTYQFLIKSQSDPEYTTDYFKFLDEIREPLYYSEKYDKLYTYEELSTTLSVEFQLYDITIEKNAEHFRLRTIDIYILNDKIDSLFYFADLRHNVINKLNTLKLKDEYENDKHPMLVLMYLLGIEKPQK